MLCTDTHISEYFFSATNRLTQPKNPTNEKERNLGRIMCFCVPIFSVINRSWQHNISHQDGFNRQLTTQNCKARHKTRRDTHHNHTLLLWVMPERIKSDVQNCKPKDWSRCWDCCIWFDEHASLVNTCNVSDTECYITLDNLCSAANLLLTISNLKGQHWVLPSIIFQPKIKCWKCYWWIRQIMCPVVDSVPNIWLVI